MRISGTRITSLTAGALVLGGILVWTLVQKAGYEQDARDQLIAQIATLDGYEHNRTIIDPIVEDAHMVAFQAAYRWRLPGRQRARRPSFSPETYNQTAYVEIIGALQATGHEDLAVAVERLRARQ